MRESSVRNQEKLSVTAESMTAEAIQDEIAAALRRLADPVTAGESVKACLRRAATRAGLPYGQAKRYWYQEASSVPAHVYLQIMGRATAHDRKLQQNMFRAVCAMQESDPDFYRNHIEAIGELLFLERSDPRKGGEMG